ncbi:hypothetical protein GE09DRAFT_568817 [Coniochaeta sp. 2T2.1]|nr:hypothetical protein GE09DRAFT_568817 [Coniochaeta sp. 2T2.1]
MGRICTVSNLNSLISSVMGGTCCFANLPFLVAELLFTYPLCFGLSFSQCSSYLKPKVSNGVCHVYCPLFLQVSTSRVSRGYQVHYCAKQNTTRRLATLCIPRQLAGDRITNRHTQFPPVYSPPFLRHQSISYQTSDQLKPKQTRLGLFLDGVNLYYTQTLATPSLPK